MPWERAAHKRKPQSALRRDLILAAEHVQSISWLRELAREHQQRIPAAAQTNLELVFKHLREMQRLVEAESEEKKLESNVRSLSERIDMWSSPGDGPPLDQPGRHPHQKAVVDFFAPPITVLRMIRHLFAKSIRGVTHFRKFRMRISARSQTVGSHLVELQNEERVRFEETSKRDHRHHATGILHASNCDTIVPPRNLDGTNLRLDKCYERICNIGCQIFLDNEPGRQRFDQTGDL